MTTTTARRQPFMPLSPFHLQSQPPPPASNTRHRALGERQQQPLSFSPHLLVSETRVPVASRSVVSANRPRTVLRPSRLTIPPLFPFTPLTFLPSYTPAHPISASYPSAQSDTHTHACRINLSSRKVSLCHIWHPKTTDYIHAPPTLTFHIIQVHPLFLANHSTSYNVPSPTGPAKLNSTLVDQKEKRRRKK
jgi:hypothetical protein